MGRTEFLEILRSQLSGQMSEGRIEAHLRYYHQYIGEQMAAGYSEEEVLSRLGDPRLIAKTLLDTDDGAEDVFYEEVGTQTYEDIPSEEHSSGTHRFHLDLSTWYGKIIVIVIAAALILLLLFVLGTLLPVLILVSLILYLISKFNKNRR